MPRLRCPEISRLPKSTKVVAVQWRNQTPGSLDPFFTLQVYKPELLVDPGHPAALIKKGVFPTIRRDDLGVKMLPLGLLLREERQYPAMPILSWRERVQVAKEAALPPIDVHSQSQPPAIRKLRLIPDVQLYPKHDYNNFLLPSHKTTPASPVLDLLLKKNERRVPMSFHIATSKVRMGQLRHQRKQLETRLRVAINLIVSKGAYYDRKEEKVGINMDDAGRKWVMQGWAYMFYPTTKLYLTPYPKLINMMRSLLDNLNKKAIQLENKWLIESLLKEGWRQDLSTRWPTVIAPSYTSDSRSNLKENKDAPVEVDPDLLNKMRLVDVQLARAREADVVATAKALSETPTSPTDLYSSNSPAINSPATYTDNDDPAAYQQAPEKLTAENFPSKILAGKPPAIWKQELMSSLSLIVKPPPPEPRKKLAKTEC